MTFDREVILLSRGTSTFDNEGNEVFSQIEQKVLCHEKSMTRSEFYQASLQGLRPNHVLVLHDFEYSGECLLIYEGKIYSVLRTYQNKGVLGDVYSGYIELTIGEKHGN